MIKPKVNLYSFKRPNDMLAYYPNLNCIDVFTSNPEKYKPILNDYFPTFFALFIKNINIDFYFVKNIEIYTREIMAHFDNVLLKSKEYRQKLLKEMSTLKKDKFMIFLESERYNNFVGKKYNPFLEIIRIRNGLLTHDVVSHDLQKSCLETYAGFLNGIKSKTLRFIKIDYGDGITNTLLVKTKTGTSQSPILHGINKLAIDPVTLDIYSIKNSSNKSELYLTKYVDNFEQLTPNLIKNRRIFKTRLNKYLREVYSKENLHKTKTELKEFILKNRKLFERKPNKHKIL